MQHVKPRGALLPATDRSASAENANKLGGLPSETRNVLHDGVYGIVDARMKEAHFTMRRLLFDAFERSLELPIEEIMRRENEALAEMLANPERYSWA